MTHYVLGINSNIHDSSACLINNGALIAAAEQERFDRRKHSDAFPVEAIEFCLAHAGITLQDVETVTFPFNSWIAVPQVVRYFFRYFPRTVPLAVDRIKKGYFSFFYANHGMKKEMARKRRTGRFPFINLEHHLCHAASAFFLSPFERAAILSIDGIGEWTSTLIASGEGNRITKVAEIGFPHSIGLIYQAVTKFLGFEINSGESKVMGLASYGDPQRYRKDFADIILLGPEGGFTINPDYIRYQYYGHNRMLSARFYQRFGAARRKGGPLTEHHMDIAAALQARVEEAAVHIVRDLHRRTGEKNLCLAGGVALNCVMNEKVKRQSPFQNLFVQPAANDAGGSIGSALLYHFQVKQSERCCVMDHAYWGPEFDDASMKHSLEKRGLTATREDDIAGRVADALVRGLTVGWFQGRMEIGPRALGNRSILADPRRPDMKDLINRKVKHREDFRPFAPSVLEECCGDVFDSSVPSPFMLQVYDVLPPMRDKVPAITHVDGTARVQTVRKDINPKYYAVIDRFRQLTGIPLVLNTSFNDNNEPIVCTPDNAVACYLKTGLDALAIGDFYCEKDAATRAGSGMSPDSDRPLDPF